MSKSLKDQLLDLGLASRKQESHPRKKRKPQNKPRKTGHTKAEISLDQAYRIRSNDEREQKQRALERKREQERRRRELNQRIRHSIKEFALRDETADKKRNFLFKGRIRSVLATGEQIKQINDGSLGVVYLSGNYHLMPVENVEEIRQFAPNHVPDLTGVESEDEKDNPVPDDLIW